MPRDVIGEINDRLIADRTSPDLLRRAQIEERLQ
jgi:hypothetical protein